MAVAELLALCLLIGGLAVIVYAVIPAVFNAGVSNETGGRLLARTFGRYNDLTAGAIGILIVATLGRFWLREPSRAETILLAVLACSFAVIVFWLRPETMALQERAFAATGVEEKKLAYEAFFRVHDIARALYIANFGLGIALLTVKAKRWVMR